MYRDNCFLIIAFILYSFCGWLWESLILPLLSGKRIHNNPAQRRSVLRCVGCQTTIWATLNKGCNVFAEVKKQL